MNSKDRIQEDHAFLTEFRHDLHQHPELMFQEKRTSQCVVAALESAGIEDRAGLAGGTGVLGFLPATEPGGATVALRADMDALPIHEETGLAYASQTPGVMHACGHDGHTTILVGTVRNLCQIPDRKNNILFIFQPAEEGGAGGEKMCEDGVLDGSIFPAKVDVAYGLHGWPSASEGEILTKDGPMMAATDGFRVRVHGQGGHAAAPHTTHDPIVAMAQIITAIQSIASRSVDPLDSIVFTIAAVHGGEAQNVIPEVVELRGTMRTLLPETRILGKDRFFEIVQGIATAMGTRAEIDWYPGYPVTANDSWATDRFRQIARDVVGEDRVLEQPVAVMGGEDFSYYGLQVPATFFFVGMRRADQDEAPSVHTPRFDFNDAVIPDCVAIMSQLALDPVLSRP